VSCVTRHKILIERRYLLLYIKCSRCRHV
jgi:hypothetical protein